jgi:hypothetical protein
MTIERYEEVMVKDTGPHRRKAGIARGRGVYSPQACIRLEARNIPYLHSCMGISQSLSCTLPRSMPVRTGTVWREDLARATETSISRRHDYRLLLDNEVL